ATEARMRDDGVAIEPWITGDGVGLLAHAAPRDGESATALAQRVANAAARTLAATIPNNEALASARATALEQLEQLAGRQASALEAFAGAIVPDHPSWVMPLGTWARVAGAGLESVRLRWQALAAGPLRAAVIANVDEAQAAAALDAIDRWITPTP